MSDLIERLEAYHNQMLKSGIIDDYDLNPEDLKAAADRLRKLEAVREAAIEYRRIPWFVPSEALKKALAACGDDDG